MSTGPARDRAFPLQSPRAGQQQRDWQFKQTRYVSPGQNRSGVTGRDLVTFAKARDQLYEELRKEPTVRGFELDDVSIDILEKDKGLDGLVLAVG